MGKKSQAVKKREQKKRIDGENPAPNAKATMKDLREMIQVGQMVGGMFASLFAIGAAVKVGGVGQDQRKEVDHTEDGEAEVISSEIKK